MKQTNKKKDKIVRHSTTIAIDLGKISLNLMMKSGSDQIKPQPRLGKKDKRSERSETKHCSEGISQFKSENVEFLKNGMNP